MTLDFELKLSTACVRLLLAITAWSNFTDWFPAREPDEMKTFEERETEALRVLDAHKLLTAEARRQLWQSVEPQEQYLAAYLQVLKNEGLIFQGKDGLHYTTPKGTFAVLMIEQDAEEIRLIRDGIARKIKAKAASFFGVPTTQPSLN